MESKYEVGVISGKFRLLNKAHKEFFIRSTLESINKLVIVIFDLSSIKRFSTISELRTAIGEILKEIDIPYEVIICKEEFLDVVDFEDFLINKIGHDNILMFNSKVEYNNVKLNNKFITCENYKIASSEIEKNLYKIRYYEQIAKEFMPYINKKIVISGVESSGKTQFCIKLSRALNTVYSPEFGRGYAGDFLGGDDEAFTPKDFVFIAQNQLLQDRRKNKDARRLLVVDTDPFITLRFLNSYYEEYKIRGVITPEFEEEYQGAKKVLEVLCSTYKCDIIFLLKPNNNFTSDGIRWEQPQEVREQRFEELKEVYKKFGQKYIEVKGDTYKDKFKFIEQHLQKVMEIY